MDFIGSRPSSSEEFVIRLPGSASALHSSMTGSTLGANNINQRMTLHVSWLLSDDEASRVTL